MPIERLLARQSRVLEELLRVLEFTEAQDVREPVVQFGRPRLQHRPEFVVAQERPICLQRAGPAERLQTRRLASRSSNGRDTGGQIRAVWPCSSRRRNARRAFDRDLRAHACWRRMVEVTPALAPDCRPIFPSPVRTGQQDFQSLRERRLTRAIPARPPA